jgi:hypothetical protein
MHPLQKISPNANNNKVDIRRFIVLHNATRGRMKTSQIARK